MNLNRIGWHPFFESQFEEIRTDTLRPARVAEEHKERYVVLGENGQMEAAVSGRYRHEAVSLADYPCVGDWVAVTEVPAEHKSTIQRLLPRRSSFSRKAVLAGGMKGGSGRTDEQILAANMDVIFLVTGLDDNYNLRRIERYIAVAWESGATPVVVLNKADLCGDLDERLEEVEAIALGVPVHVVSALEHDGLEVFADYLTEGRTGVFLGSSGVGKSTIINGLLGEDRLATRDVREADGRGRHTTTFRQMILLPTGGVVIDTPGIREIQMWDGEEALRHTFDDVEELASRCRFSDCRHTTEPGCAIREAIESGDLDPDRYANYIKLLKELKHLALRKQKKEIRREERDFNKKIRQHSKQVDDLRRRGLM